jgi:hypothetical protein
MALLIIKTRKKEEQEKIEVKIAVNAFGRTRG